jgi:putative copper export protein
MTRTIAGRCCEGSDKLTRVLTWAWYTAILLTVGSTSAAYAFAQSPRWPRRLTALSLCASLLLFTMVLLRLWSQTWDAFGGDQPLTFAHARVILFDTPWGTGWMWQAGASLLTCLSVVVWRWRWSFWPVAALCASAAAFTTALTGHAMGMPDQVWLTVPAHGLHVIAAGWWIGALTMILLVTSGSDCDRDTAARIALAGVIDRFSPVAIVAVSVLFAAGLIATWQHVLEPAGLGGIASPYGLALAGKIAAFCGAALCGLYNWRVLRPMLASSPDAARQLRTMAWLEVLMGVVALVLTALMGTLSMPEPPGGH